MDFYNFNRGWNNIDGFIKELQSYKNKSAYEYIKLPFLFIAYCRDIVRGKGERDLSYKLIYAFYQVFPILALKALHLLFLPREGIPPVGSWGDLKYFCLCIEKISP